MAPAVTKPLVNPAIAIMELLCIYPPYKWIHKLLSYLFRGMMFIHMYLAFKWEHKHWVKSLWPSDAIQHQIAKTLGSTLIRHDPTLSVVSISNQCPDSKVHGANMGPTWVLSAPGGPHVGPINLAIRVYLLSGAIAWTDVQFCSIRPQGSCLHAFWLDMSWCPCVSNWIVFI